MTRYAILPLATLLTLAACNSEPEVDLDNASQEEAAQAVADAGGSDIFVNPGRWQTTVTLEEMNVPGMPAQMAEQMKAQMNAVETTESCLTREEARRPREDFFAGAQENCTYNRFTMAGGRIDAEMTCQEGGASMTMAIDGTYSADHYAARSTMTMTGAGAEGGMTVRSRVEAKRLGDCA